MMEADIFEAMSIAEWEGHTPQQIYAFVTNGVAGVIRALDVRAEDPDDEAVRAEVIDDLYLMQAEVGARQEELRASADWKDFTVALYGETNAGKSTLVEALRIHLNEPSKREQRRLFDKVRATYGLDDAALKAAQVATDQGRASVAAASSYGAQLATDSQAQLQILEQEETQLARQARAARVARAWWQKLICLFRRAREDIAWDKIKTRIIAQRAQQQHEQHQTSVRIEAACIALANAEDDLARRLRALPLLIAHADGSIIGDGRPDFTTKTQRYHFNLGQASFVLLDVPGIEGNEDKVKDHIDKAVQTAHAVFYVTRKAARPQHGDQADGTLEKIKRHLGPQTEVWAIFNKSIPAPGAFQTSSGLFTRDSEGLADLEQGMRDALGANFMGVLPVSAYPAFLAMADRLPHAVKPMNAEQVSPDRKRDREKFLLKFDAAAILERSAFPALSDRLASMAIDAPTKIRKANINKASQSLQQFVKDLDRHATTMETHATKVAAQTKVAQGQVDKAVLKLGSSLRVDADNALRALETGVRHKIYEQIEAGIGTDHLKADFRSCLESYVIGMKRDVENKFKDSTVLFQSDIVSATERFQKHLNDLGKMAGAQVREIPDSSLNVDLCVKNGVSIVGLVTTAIGGAVLLFSNPAGWVVITLGVASIAVSLVKALWSLLDDDFRKAQQRKALDENLAKAVAILKKDLERGEKTFVIAVDSLATEAKEQLGGPQRNVKSQTAMLRRSADRLRAFGIKIETTIA